MPSFLWFSEKWPHAIFIIKKILDDEDGEFEDCELTFFQVHFHFSRQKIMMEYLLIDSGSCWILLLCHCLSCLCSYFHAPHLISIPALKSFSCPFLLRLLASSGLYLTQWMPKFPKTTFFISSGVITVSYKKQWRVRDTVLGALLIFITRLVKHSIFRESIFIYRAKPWRPLTWFRVSWSTLELLLTKVNNLLYPT